MSPWNVRLLSQTADSSSILKRKEDHQDKRLRKLPKVNRKYIVLRKALGPRWYPWPLYLNCPKICYQSFKTYLGKFYERRLWTSHLLMMQLIVAKLLIVVANKLMIDNIINRYCFQEGREPPADTNEAEESRPPSLPPASPPSSAASPTDEIPFITNSEWAFYFSLTISHFRSLTRSVKLITFRRVLLARFYLLLMKPKNSIHFNVDISNAFVWELEL